MKLPFIKMHGAGNDYIYIDGFHFFIPDPNTLSLELSDRHFGIGGDGIILILPSNVADCKMRMFNADGSEGLMCGNAIRCVGKWMYEQENLHVSKLTVETLSGIKTLSLEVKQRKVVSVSVQMGKAQFLCREIPVDFTEETCIDHPLLIGQQEYPITTVSMGNPHAVIFTNHIDQLPLEHLGPQFEHHPMFPERVNTEFVEVLSPTHLKMRVWERGSGETWACGTGACAAVAAAIKTHKATFNTPITVSLRGGDLIISVNSLWEVTMTGNAVTVFSGEVERADVMTINNQE